MIHRLTQIANTTSQCNNSNATPLDKSNFELSKSREDDKELDAEATAIHKGLCKE
jgi:hypothetical protein